jgi:zona occludens toxin (predicted ATPase)
MTYCPDCPAVTEALEGADGASVVMSMSGRATVSARAPPAQTTLSDAAIQQIRFMSVLIIPDAIPVKAGQIPVSEKRISDFRIQRQVQNYSFVASNKS